MDPVRIPAADDAPLEWTEPVLREAAFQDALRAAQECAALYLEIVPLLPNRLRGRITIVFVASCLAAERLEEDRHDTAAVLALCVRIIDSNLSAIDEGLLTHDLAAPARRCADRCRRALAALYLCADESV